MTDAAVDASAVIHALSRLLAVKSTEPVELADVSVAAAGNALRRSEQTGLMLILIYLHAHVPPIHACPAYHP